MPEQMESQVSIDELQMEEINPFEGFDQEAPLPQEPSVDELIDEAVKEKEEQIQNLTMQLYDKQHENEYLRKTIQDQETSFNTIMARLVISLLGDK